MTVEFMLLALALFGGVTLREFAVILLVGLFSVLILQSLLRLPSWWCGKTGVEDVVPPGVVRPQRLDKSLSFFPYYLL